MVSLPFLQRLTPELPVWQLRANALGMRHRKTEEAKIEVLERLRAFSMPVFLVYSEDPIADEVPGQWERVTVETLRVPPDADLGAMVRWLYLGGWMLYAADEPIETTELLSMGFAPTAQAIVKAADRLRLAFIVVSFHDDVLWTIALGNAESSEQHSRFG